MNYSGKSKMMKRYEDGGPVDAMEEANKRTEYTLTNPNAKEYGESGTSYTTKAAPKAMPRATPKAMPKAAPKAAPKPAAKVESKPAPKAAAVDDTKMSVADRAKASRERARAGSGTTDTRSVGERLKSAFGMKSGGSVKPSKMGGVKTAKPSFGSASKRADGVASKGKTRGKYI
jgi:hypothetical protein